MNNKIKSKAKISKNINKTKFSNLTNEDFNSFEDDEDYNLNDLQIKRNKSKEELDLLYHKHCFEVQEKYEKILLKNPKKNIERERYIDFKRCETCFDFINDKLLLLCEVCDDGYHTYCLDPPQETIPKTDFICLNCFKQMSKTKSSRQQKFEEFKFIQNSKTQIIINSNTTIKVIINLIYLNLEV